MTELAAFMAGVLVTLGLWAALRAGEAVEREDATPSPERLARVVSATATVRSTSGPVEWPEEWDPRQRSRF